MSRKRTARVGDLLREVLVELIRHELRDPRVQTATVTEVEVTPDLRRAKVFVSTLGDAQQRAACVRALNAAAPRLRRLLAPQVRLRAIPELQFVEDLSAERGMRIEELLQQIRDEHRARDEIAGTGDDEPCDDDT